MPIDTGRRQFGVAAAAARRGQQAPSLAAHSLRSGERRISQSARTSPSGRGASLIKIIGADLEGL